MRVVVEGNLIKAIEPQSLPLPEGCQQAFGLKRAIDEGLTPGPRIYRSGAFLSQTSGHGDFRLLSELPRSPESGLTYAEKVGITAICDGPAQVLLRAREQLMRGASQLKYMGGGGVMSPHDALARCRACGSS